MKLGALKKIFRRPSKTTPPPSTDRIAQPRKIDIYPSYPSSGLTPQRLATILKQADIGDVYRQSELFEEFEEKDDQIFSELQKRKLALARLNWEIVPASDDAQDVKVAEFIDASIEGIENFEGGMVNNPETGEWAKGGMIDILDAIGKGFSVNEIEWEVSENQIVPRRLHYVPQKRFTFYHSDDGLTPRLLTEEEPIKGIPLEVFKFIFHVHPAKSGLPSRASLLRPLSYLYLFKHFAIKDWVIFMEAFGHPLRTAKHRTGATDEEKKAIIDALKSLGVDAAGMFPDGTEIEIHKADVRANADLYDKFLHRCDRAISKVILGATLGTEEGSSGSYSLGQVHGAVTQDLLESDCELLSTTFRGQLFRPTVWWNFGRDVKIPRIKFKYEIEEDLNQRMERDEKAVKAGVQIGQTYFANTYGYPKLEKGEEPVRPAGGPQPFTQQDEQAAAGRCGCGGCDINLGAGKKKIERSLESATLSGSKKD